jgi:Protein of unknown function (DUF3768)
MADQLKRVRHTRKLDDKFRWSLPHGNIFISRAVGGWFSNNQLRAIMQLIRDYDAFGADSDLDEWHDHGIFEFDAARLAWNMGAREQRLKGSPPDPADKKIVRLRLSIARADDIVGSL